MAWRPPGHRVELPLSSRPWVSSESPARVEAADGKVGPEAVTWAPRRSVTLFKRGTEHEAAGRPAARPSGRSEEGRCPMCMMDGAPAPAGSTDRAQCCGRAAGRRAGPERGGELPPRALAWTWRLCGDAASGRHVTSTGTRVASDVLLV